MLSRDIDLSADSTFNVFVLICIDISMSATSEPSVISTTDNEKHPVMFQDFKCLKKQGYLKTIQYKIKESTLIIMHTELTLRLFFDNFLI